MKNELSLMRIARRLALAAGLTLAAAGAQAQSPPPAGDGAPPAAEATSDAPARNSRRARPQRSRGEIRPYLEVSQVLSADLNGGETLTYTSVAAGVDGHVQTRRVTAQMSYRYERNIEWNGAVGDRDIHSGIAAVSAQIVPGAVTLDAGALATRTAGEGRALGVTDRDAAVNVYSVFAGPTVATHAGPVAVNASYRLGYVNIDDDRVAGPLSDDYDSSVAHSATASVGMAPGRLPVGWTVGAGYAREDSAGRFDNEFEGAYVRGDVVVPVGPTLALTAGVGYEDIEASQYDVLRDSTGIPVVDAAGRPSPDPTRPRLLTYNVSGVMYDAGLIWRPSARTELQARAGHRYGGTTVVGSLTHQFNEHYGMSAQVFDTVETFGQRLNSDLGSLPDNVQVNRDPLTGALGGCAFGATGGSGVCLDRSLQSVTGSTFRARGGSLIFSGSRGRWNFGAGASYANRRYFRPSGNGFDGLAPTEDEVYSLYASLGHRLSRTSDVSLNAYASRYDSDLAALDDVTTLGATASYSRNFLVDRLRFLAALGLTHSDSGTEDASNASALAGLRYTF